MKRDKGRLLPKDITGNVYNHLTALVGTDKRSRGSVVWVCKCVCGRLLEVSAAYLTGGYKKSCGCLDKKCGRRAIPSRKLPEYEVWRNMIRRCRGTSGSNRVNASYNGRGISTCTQWEDSFEQFISDMGPRPSKLHSIDRIDNDGDYEPGNCRWATRAEQSRNTRSTILITHGGKTQCVRDWAKETCVCRNTITNRYRKGVRGDALFAPVRKRAKTMMVEHDGKRMHIKDWAKVTGVCINTLKGRYYRGLRGYDLLKKI